FPPRYSNGSQQQARISSIFRLSQQLRKVFSHRTSNFLCSSSRVSFRNHVCGPGTFSKHLIDGGLHRVGRVGHLQAVAQQQRGRADRGDGVGQTLPRDVGGRPVHGLVNSRAIARTQRSGRQ